MISGLSHEKSRVRVAFGRNSTKYAPHSSKYLRTSPRQSFADSQASVLVTADAAEEQLRSSNAGHHHPSIATNSSSTHPLSTQSPWNSCRNGFNHSVACPCAIAEEHSSSAHCIQTSQQSVAGIFRISITFSSNPSGCFPRDLTKSHSPSATPYATSIANIQYLSGCYADSVIQKPLREL
jgi:hypothetical protein